MLHKKCLLILFLVLPVSLLYQSYGFANAQIDIADDDDDEEAEVEDSQSEDAAVVGQEGFVQEDGGQEATLRPSPDVDATLVFTQPPGRGSELPAGQDVHFLVGFSNRGSRDFVVDSMDASFRYPLDFSFHIHNFSSVSYGRVVRPRTDASLHYAFHASEAYGARPFGLVVNLFYRDQEGQQYHEAVFNETVTIVEIEESLDGETFFLYVLLAAVLVLALVVLQQFLVGFTKKKLSSGQKMETGTTNHLDDVDYDWLPKETLSELNKSPRRSERLSPRKSKQQQQVSPPSPKQQQQPTQRRAKRGAARDE